MPSIADYDVVLDASVEIGSPNNDEDWPISVPANINLASRSVLSYMVDPGPLATLYTLSILQADGSSTPLGSFGSAAGGVHVRQEVVPGNVLRKTGSRLKVQVTAGSARFSDIVLMYQCNV